MGKIIDECRRDYWTVEKQIYTKNTQDNISKGKEEGISQIKINISGKGFSSVETRKNGKVIFGLHRTEKAKKIVERIQVKATPTGLLQYTRYKTVVKGRDTASK